MRDLVERIEIDAPPERVWAAVTDWARQGEWMLATDVRDGTLKPEKVSEREIAKRLYHPDMPEPDLLIRTSGEERISNGDFRERAARLGVQRVARAYLSPENRALPGKIYHTARRVCTRAA